VQIVMDVMDLSRRSDPIRSVRLGSNRLSLKYVESVPVQSVLGMMINRTGWANVINLNVSSYLPPEVYNGVEWYTTDLIEIPWRLLDHGFTKPDEKVLWYIIPRGHMLGRFHFFRASTSSTSVLSNCLQRLLASDDIEDMQGFQPTIEGSVSIDSFVCKASSCDPWLLYNALCVMIPDHMFTHSIAKIDVSNRKHLISRRGK